jgi:cobalt-precorrin 5A hydrolase
MYSKGIAIIAITKNGVDVALKIKRVLNSANCISAVYAPEKYVQDGVLAFDVQLDEFFKEKFSSVSAFVAVMANGIIIRVIAPYLKGKLVDPAVVGVDVAGKFVTSLLSGHYGGANELAALIANGIGAVPVITTASDVLGKQSVDTLARSLHLTIVNPESLVSVNSAIVNGGRLVLILLRDVKVPYSQFAGYDVKCADNENQALAILADYDAGAVITKTCLSLSGVGKPVTILKVKEFTVGVGARKEITAPQVVDAIVFALKLVNVPIEYVTQIATVDIKKDSQSMIYAVASLGFDLKFISVDELRALRHEDLSADSKIVQRNIGVGGVCERVALIIAGKNAHLILKKQKMNGVTVAIAVAE